MPKPRIIRADTIDLQLQDHAQPSAQNHSKPPQTRDSDSSVATHQAETLRQVALETADENLRSPRRPSCETESDGVKARSQFYLDDSSDDHHDGDDDRDDNHHHNRHNHHSHHDYDDSDDSDDIPRAGHAGGTNSRHTASMHQQDDLAIAQNGGFHDDSDMDMNGDDLDDDMNGGISSSPSIEDEDIDFEFVYALHTFVATVEGQANATKGDTMVLLDDSNSYWWLVRIVKDSSIGYLPAEHIETPTERLARLNKHRNIDLSATMLGDQQEKSKATFKTSIMRRKKTVTFAAPTYVDYSEVEYSTDEDEDQEEVFARQQQAAQHAREQQQEGSESQQDGDDDGVSDTEDESAKVEPLKPRATKEGEGEADQEEQDGEADLVRRSSEDIFDGKADGVSRSRNGTMRNTDSFFKDDTVETKKITLTPNLLRDDSTPRESTESAKEMRPRPSLDKLLERDQAGAAKDGRGKKDKDKRPSVIRNFFSRKDKKGRGSGDDEEGWLGKGSMDSGTRDSRDDEPDDAVYAVERNNGLQRSPSKLQKQQPRTELSPTRKGGSQRAGGDLAYVSETRNDVSNVPPATMRIVDSETRQTIEVASGADMTQSKASSPRGSAGDAPGGQAAEGEEEEGDREGAQSQARGSPSANRPPPLIVDTSSQEDHSESPSPDLLEGDAAGATVKQEQEEEAWDDDKLRAFFDSGSDIRDMLVVVFDKTDVAPAGPDHPVVGSLFREQNAKLAEITTQLDNMLGDWLARKQRTRGT